MKIKLILLSALILVIALFFFFSRLTSSKKTETEKVISVGKMKITAEVANTEAKRSQGLSDRTSLPQNRGILFVFEKKGRYAFWMKGMKFPLDFIWIDGNQVAQITENVPYPKDGDLATSFAPSVDFDKVLEVNAGVANSSGVKIGDQILGL